MTISETTNPARGPWIAVATDGAGEVLDIGDLSHIDQRLEAEHLESITVVRGPNVPDVRDDARRLPEVIYRTDVLYEIEDLGDDPELVPIIWEQALAIAAALNAVGLVERWRADPGAFPDGAADVLEQIVKAVTAR